MDVERESKKRVQEGSCMRSTAPVDEWTLMSNDFGDDINMKEDSYRMNICTKGVAGITTLSKSYGTDKERYE